MKISKLIGKFLLLCLCHLCAVSVSAQSGAARQRILIDGSGSMTGFFATQKIKDLYAIIHDQSGANVDPYYFVDYELKPFDEMEDKPRGRNEVEGRFGSGTYLENALKKTLDAKPMPGIVWLITDNQPSAGNDTESDKDIEKFYEGLYSDRVKRIYFFPLRLPFKGTLYKADGHAALGGTYENLRGLLVYALLLDDQDQEEFERAVTGFQERFMRSFGSNELRRIMVKPLEQDTVTASLLPGDKFKVDGNKIVGGDFEEGKPIHGNFKLELVSNLGHIKIDRAEIDVNAGKFSTGDFTDSDLIPKISPRELENFRSGPQNKKEFTVTLDFNGVHTVNGLKSWWHSMNENRGYLDGNVQVSIKVPPQSFALVPESVGDFSTNKDIYEDSSPEVQKRIYKLDGLVQKMIPNQTFNVQPRIGNHSDGQIPVHLSVAYSARHWPYIVALILLVALVVCGIFLLKRRPMYSLTWDNGTARACPDFRLGLFSRQPITIDNHSAATLKKGLSGVKVQASRDYMVDERPVRVLNTAGADFNISRRNDGVGVNFQFSKVSATGAASKSTSADIFGDTSYGPASGEGSMIASRKPVRKPTTGAKVGSDAGGAATGDHHDLDSFLR
jgi:hypothetical protein